MDKLRNSVIMPRVLKLCEEKAVLGLEYFVELVHCPGNHLKYSCMLCQVENKDILKHFVSREHTQNYMVRKDLLNSKK